MYKIVRTSTIPASLAVLLNGQLKFLNEHFEVVAVSGEGPDLERVQSREGVRVISVNMERKISPFKDLISLINLYRVLLKEKPLIVHSITPKAGLLTMAAGYFAGIPIRMHTFTGLIFPTRKGKMQKLLIAMDRLLCKFATHIYPEGQGVMNDLHRFNITTKPLSVIGNGNVNGIDENYFDPAMIGNAQKEALRSKLGIGSDDFVFVFVGRLVGDKGINELIIAFQEFSKDTPNARLLLVGEPEPLLDPLRKETIQEIKMNHLIISVGFQDDVRPYYAISQVLILPSWREGFPNVVLQGGAMGLPCIVTDINGSNEIISNNENGLIVEVNDPIGLKRAMDMFINDQNFYQKAASKARINIVENYRRDLVWNALLNEYNLLIENV